VSAAHRDARVPRRCFGASDVALGGEPGAEPSSPEEDERDPDGEPAQDEAPWPASRRGHRESHGDGGDDPADQQSDEQASLRYGWLGLQRLVTNDDAAEAARALRLLQSDRVWVSRTVLLEAEWVLRHAYRLERAAIGRAFSLLAAVPTIEVEARPAVLRALAWQAEGMDFADALHVASSDAAKRFATFDRALVRAAKQVGTSPPVVAP
jgi:predicted nucleic-acid-binding protein